MQTDFYVTGIAQKKHKRQCNGPHVCRDRQRPLHCPYVKIWKYCIT